MEQYCSEIDTIKSKSSEEIEEYCLKMVKHYEDSYNEFLNVLLEGRYGNQLIDNNNLPNSQKLLFSIFLSLILATVASNLYNPYIKELYISKINDIAKKYDIDYKNLLDLTYYEKVFLKIIC